MVGLLLVCSASVFFSSSAKSILYRCCMYQCSFCIPLLSSHFYTVLRPDQNQNSWHQTQTSIRPPHHRPSHLMLLLVGNDNWIKCDLIGCGPWALPFFLTIWSSTSNHYLAFGSQSAASLMSLSLINLLIESRSDKVQKERNKNLRCRTVITDLEELTQGKKKITRTPEVSIDLLSVKGGFVCGCAFREEKMSLWEVLQIFMS